MERAAVAMSSLSACEPSQGVKISRGSGASNGFQFHVGYYYSFGGWGRISIILSAAGGGLEASETQHLALLVASSRDR